MPKRRLRASSKLIDAVRNVVSTVGRGSNKLTATGHYVFDKTGRRQFIRSKMLDFLISYATSTDIAIDFFKHLFLTNKIRIIKKRKH